MATHIVYSIDFLKHDNATHPENAQRLLVMINEIKKAPFYDKLEFIEPEILPEEMLNDVHSYEMIERIKDMSSNGGSWLDPDTFQYRYPYPRVIPGPCLLRCRALQELLHSVPSMC